MLCNNAFGFLLMEKEDLWTLNIFIRYIFYFSLKILFFCNDLLIATTIGYCQIIIQQMNAASLAYSRDRFDEVF